MIELLFLCTAGMLKTCFSYFLAISRILACGFPAGKAVARILEGVIPSAESISMIRAGVNSHDLIAALNRDVCFPHVNSAG